MNKIIFIGILLFFFKNVTSFAQTKTDTILRSKETPIKEKLSSNGMKIEGSDDHKKTNKRFLEESIQSTEIDPLTPAKAAFYSAILPGLGQAYNKKYWKIPIVYAAIGTSAYLYIDNTKKYNQYRDAYKSRLAGNPDPNYNYLTDTQLISAQEFYQRNASLSALFMLGFYVLNIIDANVDAALIQFNVNQNLSLRPEITPPTVTGPVTLKSNLGLTLNYNF